MSGSAGVTARRLRPVPRHRPWRDDLSDLKHAMPDAGQKTADKAGQAKEWVEDKTGLGCGSARVAADIKPHMSVVSSCGCTVGKVDHVEGNAIKLTKNDSPDGQHHFVPTSWVDHVDNHVHLTKNADEARRGWKADAAGCC